MTNAPSPGRRRLIGVAAGLTLVASGGAGAFWALDRQNSAPVADQAFEVDVESVVDRGLESIADDMETELRRAGLGAKRLSVENAKIVGTLEPGDQGDIAVARIRETWPGIAVSSNNGRFEATYPEAVLTQVRQDILSLTLTAIQADLADDGIDRDAIRIGGERCILVPGESHKAVLTRLVNSGPRAKLNFRIVELIIGSATGATEMLPWIKGFYSVDPGSMAVGKRALLAGDYRVDAQVELEDGNPIVVLRFDLFTRQQRFRKLQFDDQLVAIVLDNQIVATVLGRDLRRERTVLRGPFSRETAEELAFVLRSLSFPAPLKEVAACPA